ncbi:hypothetical protein QBC32DRAFT_328865 [Pseudoneurospora amorphoporcata]|uniref:Uncharacterized protein n=1 Tax=Pseudoneurospora amorphoporcata TaxID=241081 RepID=A0AAN6SB18_9PEZI|nr:hypothetical protein QBC32DRAFT_328865 [Pseudoneurospora amorphoporcata]
MPLATRIIIERHRRSAVPSLQALQFNSEVAHSAAHFNRAAPDNLIEAVIGPENRPYNSASNTVSTCHFSGSISSIKAIVSQSDSNNLTSAESNNTGASPTLDAWELDLFYRLSQAVYRPDDLDLIGQFSCNILAEGGQHGGVAAAVSQPTFFEPVIPPNTIAASSEVDFQHTSFTSMTGEDQDDHEVELPFPSLPPAGWDEPTHFEVANDGQVHLEPVSPHPAHPPHHLLQVESQQAHLPDSVIRQPISFESALSQPAPHAPPPSEFIPVEDAALSFTYDEISRDPAQAEPCHGILPNLEHADPAPAEPVPAGAASAGAPRAPILITAKCRFAGCEAKA